MGVEDGAGVLGVVLRADVPAVVGQLEDLGQATLGVHAGNSHARRLELLAILVVELEAVAVTLLNVGHAIGLCNFCARFDAAGIGAQSHRAAQVGDGLLILHQVDDVVGGLLVHLGAVGIGQAQHVAGKLDDHALHAQADAKGGHVVLTAPLEGHILALDAALPESRCHDDAVVPGQQLLDVAVVDVLAVDVVELEAAVMVGAGVQQALVDALVGILQRDVLAHQADAHHLAGALELGQEFVPLVHVGLALCLEAGFLQDDVVQALLVHLEGHLIDGRHVQRLHHSVGAHVTELSHLLQHRGWQLVLGAQHEHVGLDTLLLQQLDTVLRGLGLELLGGADVGDVGQVHADAAPAQFPAQLTDGLDERQGLDVAHGAADLGDDEVILARGAQQFHVALDLIGDVRDDLDGLAQVVAAALLVDHALIDATRRHVVGAGGLDVGEALIVAQVQVGLMAIDGHVALAVLIGVQRARVDVDVGVKLLAGDTVAAREQQARDARGDDAFSQRRNHAAGDKDVSCFHFFFHYNQITCKGNAFFPKCRRMSRVNNAKMGEDTQSSRATMTTQSIDRADAREIIQMILKCSPLNLLFISQDNSNSPSWIRGGAA